MHIAEEETKFGLDEEELNSIMASSEFQEMKNIRITGLMGWQHLPISKIK
jgi:uncharacterized pyridoxal phosphate-containing UPF0001 family protein